jgi:hypothetical protein
MLSSTIWVYNNFAIVDIPGQPELYSYTLTSARFQIFYHVFTLFLKLFGIYSKTTFTYSRNTLILINMSLTCYLLFRLGNNFYLFRKFDAGNSLSAEGYMTYMMIELLSFWAYMISFTIFLIFRSFTPHKMAAEPDVPEAKRLPECDFVTGCFCIVDSYVNATYPFVMSILMQFMPD